MTTNYPLSVYDISSDDWTRSLQKMFLLQNLQHL
jgi:hypothetical protein